MLKRRGGIKCLSLLSNKVSTILYMAQAEETYDRFYENDADTNPLWGTQREIALTENIITKISPKMRSILEVGCGDGFLLHLLQKRGPSLSLEGVDLSEKRIARSRKNVPGGNFKIARVEKLPFSDNYADVVVCSEVIEHLPEPQVALAELIRVAKHRVIITVPNDQPVVPVDCPHCQKRHYLSGHLHQINEKIFLAWIDKNNKLKISFRKFHTIFSYNRITLKWPSVTRRILDRTLIKTSSAISFFKPNFLMMIIDKP